MLKPSDHNSLTPTSDDNEFLVRVSGVSKKFCRDLKKSLWYGMKDVATELLPIKHSKLNIQNSEDALRPGEFWANKDISFKLKRGECIGLIGHNGAGKTTLLKMLNGLIKPDQGTIEMRGRVGALIALGAGFNPILTGRENIYVSGSILGLTKQEIDAKIEDIIDFAEIREFIDSPVQSYSSGMQVRLGFAVATAMDPDILILDEVLAVGDAAFRAKCLMRISQMMAKACVIFVSHSESQVRHICDRVVLLSNGFQKFEGDVTKGFEIYHRKDNIKKDNITIQQKKWQLDEDCLHCIQVSSFIEKRQERNHVVIYLEINASANFELEYLRVALCSTRENVECFIVSECKTAIPIGCSKWRLEASPIDLVTGNYSLNIFMSDRSRKRIFSHGVDIHCIEINSCEFLGCSYVVPSLIRKIK
jgi:lipopolysaccharide transport system ATP-binding protein